MTRSQAFIKSRFSIRGDVVYITLTKGHTATIDASDLPLVERSCWIAQPAWKDSSKFYAKARIGNKLVKLHRVILGVEDSAVQVDHINGDTLDNRRVNLRTVSPIENSRNRALQRNNKSGCPGVHWVSRDGCWRVYIAGKFIGDFEDLAVAIAARKREEELRYGEYRRKVTTLL